MGRRPWRGCCGPCICRSIFIFGAHPKLAACGHVVCSIVSDCSISLRAPSSSQRLLTVLPHSRWSRMMMWRSVWLQGVMAKEIRNTTSAIGKLERLHTTSHQPARAGISASVLDSIIRCSSYTHLIASHPFSYWIQKFRSRQSRGCKQCLAQDIIRMGKLSDGDIPCFPFFHSSSLPSHSPLA